MSGTKSEIKETMGWDKPAVIRHARIERSARVI